MTTVLIVDDSAMDRRLAAGLLQKKTGTGVLFAGDGCEALEILQSQSVDLVVTDLQMPEMDGLELVAAVREQHPLIPVVLMTGKGSEEIAVRALEQGAASYVTKKMLARDLPETVQRVLGASIEDRNRLLLKNRMTTGDFEFVLENNSSLLSTVVSFVSQLLREFQICDENEYVRIGTALDEALHNAFYHGNLEISSELKLDDGNRFYELARERCRERPYSERRIYVRTSFTQHEIRLTVRDEGQGFDPGGLPDPTDPENLVRPFGRGILLMKTFMDELLFNDVGNEITLVKRRSVAVGEVSD